MNVVADLGRDTNTKAACAALGVPRATYYRQVASKASSNRTVRPAPPLALSAMEEQSVLNALHEPRFRDFAPPQV